MNYSKALIEHSNDMDDIYKTIEKYNPKYQAFLMIWFLKCLVIRNLIQQ